MKFVLVPKITEKTTQLVTTNNTYTFVVRGNKETISSLEVERYVKETFDVAVEEINVQNRLGKVKRTGRQRREHRQPTNKIVYVKLAAGNEIPGFIFTEEEEKAAVEKSDLSTDKQTKTTNKKEKKTKSAK